MHGKTRVVIVGAGIAGLSSYLWLEHLNITKLHDVTIYESRKQSHISQGSNDGPEFDASTIGACIGLAPNGLQVIKRLSRELYDEVVSSGHPITSWKLSTARGWVLADAVATDSRGLNGLMIGRHALWESFRRRVPDKVVQTRKVTSVQTSSVTSMTVLDFVDGSSIEADIVIGADGIWSAVRKSIFDNQYPPRYEGLVGVGGFIPASFLGNLQNGVTEVVFGRNGFFGLSRHLPSHSQSSKAACWWSTRSLKEPPPDWRSIDAKTLQNELRERHAGWQNEAVQKIIANSEVDTVWPTFTTPLLPVWHRGSCILIGDAAHALQPSSGQGVSQALEDSEVFARLLIHHISRDEGDHGTGSFDLLCKRFSDVRMPRLKKIHDKALQTSSVKQDMGVVAEFIMYVVIWAISKFHSPA
ncbi:FAD/NAD(P)-binding domain-containing protein [Polychaeton citri CBS 116435]|uniref:FAD/NAD(P)-binding domain-containing protein n=1 Tax=Polychaeton citri CBS 116435 TaxID=1314669 RepID=A0A9P4UPG8_9PEZI|nr:FAD/NAD(P)-binding domain-containing protein [Polychaeton citri CBS 116435]